MDNNIEINNKILNSLCELGNSDIKFYHYTTMSGIKGIFSEYIKKVNKNPNSKECMISECNLRASNVRYLNDSMEYKEGVSTLKKAINSFNPSELDENIYNISFCRNGNLLSQWDRYGKNSGIAIEFNFSSNTQLGFVRQIKRKEEEKEPSCRWHYMPISVGYEKQEELYEKVKNIINSKITGNDTDDIINAVFVPLCKNIGFKQEEESRIIIYAQPIENFIYDIDYVIDEDNGIVKPALNVLLKNMDNKSNIVKSITVGPGKNQNLIFNALIHIFDRKNYHFYEEDRIPKWVEKAIPEEENNLYDTRNYFYGKENGTILVKNSDNSVISEEIKALDELLMSMKNSENIIKINAIKNAIKIIKQEEKRIISEEIKKDSIENFIVHKCENGIIIKKSLIPYRG